MNGKLSTWLKKEIKLPFKLPRQNRPPPAWVRWTGKTIIWLPYLILIWFAVWRILLHWEIDRRFTAIRAAGLPTSGQELNAWRPQVPDAENGALILTQAFALTRTFPDSRSNTVSSPNLLERTNQWSAADHDLVTAYVLTNRPAIARIQEAMLFAHFRFPLDFSYCVDTERPHLDQLQTLARIVALQAALSAEAKGADDWPDQVALLLKLASTIDEEPSLISHLARNRIVRIAVTVTERNLNRAKPSEDACRTLQETFASAGETNMLPRAFIGERAILIPIFRLGWAEIQNLDHQSEGDKQPRNPQHYAGKPAFGLWLTGIFERDLSFFLQTMDKSISLANIPAPKCLVLTNELDKAAEVADKRFYLYSAMYLPALANTIVREANYLAQVRATQTALAVERFRLGHGKLPQKLGELVPQFLSAVPEDPFDGKPLRYHRLEGGYVVYSIGSDGQDNGGRERPTNVKSIDKTPYDITFTVER